MTLQRICRLGATSAKRSNSSHVYDPFVRILFTLLHRVDRIFFKSTNTSNTPMTTFSTLKCFMRGSERARQTLGHVVSYATAHLDQFRIHVFFILLFHDSARLMRWDYCPRLSERMPSVQAVFLEVQPCRCYGARPQPCFTKMTKKFLFDQLQFAADPGDSDPDRHRPREGESLSMLRL